MAVYVDAHLGLRALVVADLPLAARAGAAIALMPAGAAEVAVEEGQLSEALYENAQEILNVTASPTCVASTSTWSSRATARAGSRCWPSDDGRGSALYAQSLCGADPPVIARDDSRTIDMCHEESPGRASMAVAPVTGACPTAAGPRTAAR